MATLQEQRIVCPYCGESLSVLVDPQEVGHEYIEDCQVCCKPIVFTAFAGARGDVHVAVRDENEP